jgi:hypothetical protein
MCLVPGMLERAPSRPSARAQGLATGMHAVNGVLLLCGLLLVISYSVWSVLQTLLFVIYAWVVLRSFAPAVPGAEPIVFVENVLSLSAIAVLNALLAVFNLINIATGKQSLTDKLQPWQLTTGIVVSGVTVAGFLVLALLAALAFRDLRETVIVAQDEESAPFMTGSFNTVSGGVGRSYAATGSSSYPPTGSYAQTQTQTQAPGRAQPSRGPPPPEKFPGKAYKLAE